MLFKNSSEVLQYAAFSTQINFPSIRATIRSVEIEHIVPVLGKELYNSLNNAYSLITEVNSLSSAHKLLLEQCRYVIGPFLCYHYAPKADVKLSDTGMTRIESDGVKTAYQEQRTDFKEENLREGEKAVELLLEFLEENKASYPEWVSSSAFLEYRSLFIKSGDEFNKYCRSHSPYRNYWAMRSKMVDVEENNIRPAITSLLFDYLKAKDVAAGTFTVKEKELLLKLKKSIAYFTVAFSIPYLNIRMDANGFTVASSATATRDEDSKRTAAGDSAISALTKSAQDAGQTWLNNALTYIFQNATDFPAWIIPREIQETSINFDLEGTFGMY